MVLPSISEKPLPFFSEQCQRLFSRSTKAKAIFHCLSNLFSNICFLSENIPSVVPRPFLKPSCSSPKLCSTLSCNLLSRILSSYFIISLSRVIPLYFPGSSASPFCFHMGIICSPVFRYFALFRACVQQPLCPSGTDLSCYIYHLSMHFIPSWCSPFFHPPSVFKSLLSVISITFTFSCT